MKKFNTKRIVTGGLIAALYVILTLISSMFGLASGIIQIRISEALAVLPYFTPIAVPALSLGCLIANILTGGTLIDIIFGTIATFLGAYVTYLLAKHCKFTFIRWLAPLPNIIANSIVIPLVLAYGYVGAEASIPYMIITVAIGEIISSGILGTLFTIAISNNPTLNKLMR